MICGDDTDVGPRLRAAAARAAAGSGSAERIQVVVQLAEGASAPALLEEPLAAEERVQGWVIESKLCELAAADGVQSVDVPVEASPK